MKAVEKIMKLNSILIINKELLHLNQNLHKNLLLKFIKESSGGKRLSSTPKKLGSPKRRQKRSFEGPSYLAMYHPQAKHN